MAKDFDLVQDDNGGGSDEKPDTSIRGSITSAIEQHKEASDEPKLGGRIADLDGDEEAPRKAPSKKSELDADNSEKGARERTPTGQFASKNKDDKGIEKPAIQKGAEQQDDDKEIPQPTDEKQPSATRPPVGWTREGKAAWNTLPADVQKSVLKREEEFSNGIKQYADKAKSFDELDAVITPYKAQIANFGVTPAQTIGKLMEWMQALGSNNQQYKHQAFMTLAQSFGYDLSNLAPRQQQQEDGEYQQPAFDPNYVDQLVQQRVQPIQQQFQSFQQQQEQQAREAARSTISNWAKDKPYFENVRTTMFNLINSGEIPINADGSLPLDAAYEKATRLNEDVWTSIQQEAEQKKLQEAQERKAREAREQAARLQKARNVGVGIRPSAPMIRPNPNQAVNGAANRKMSVRDSLRLSMNQLRDGE